MAAHKSTRARFESKYAPCPISGCWIWMHGCGPTGYGYVWNRDKMVLAHRWSWEIHNGAIPVGMNVLHRCDVRCCVNPTHLFVGSQADNMHDMNAKGRSVHAPHLGEKHGGAKLSNEQVIAIRRDGRCGPKLAAIYGVNKSTINRIKSSQNWRHI